MCEPNSSIARHLPVCQRPERSLISMSPHRAVPVFTTPEGLALRRNQEFEIRLPPAASLQTLGPSTRKALLHPAGDGVLGCGVALIEQPGAKQPRCAMTDTPSTWSTGESLLPAVSTSKRDGSDHAYPV